MSPSDLFAHNFYCIVVCPDRRVTASHQRSRWWCLFWFDGQARWNWSCCDCHWCSHFLRKGCSPCWLHKPSWPFPEGNIGCPISYACILDWIVNVLRCLYYITWLLQVLTAIGNFCICSIAVGMFVEIIVMYPIQHRAYRPGIDNLLVLLIGGIPIAMPTVLSVTMAIGSHRLSQQVRIWIIISIASLFFPWISIDIVNNLNNVSLGSYHKENDCNWGDGWHGCSLQW